VYSTTFVGEVLKRYDTERQTGSSSDDKLGEITRVGSMALVLFSCVSLAASVALPWVIEAPPSDELHHRKKLPSKGVFARFLRSIEHHKPQLTDVWMWGHVSFAGLMFLTLFASTVSFATLLVALSGV
jgi:solute carrier family 45 protein 1/2/4